MERQAKDIVKGIKRRIGSRNPKVQLLALTLLETIIKNCGDIVHMHVAEKNVLQEMVRIVKKKPDLQVKEKILVLIDTWQEAFGGPRARYPQYYAAYQELLRAGAVFPQRSDRAAAPVFTPPQSHPLSSYSENVQNSALDGVRAESSADAEYPTLSLSELQNARGSMDVLAEMLNAIDPGNKEGLRQEALTDLVEQCRTYKQRVVHLVNSTADESLLCQGLAMNDDLQRVLAKYESVVSGAPVEAEKSKPEPAIRDLVDVDSPRQFVDAGESSKQANERSTLGANTSTLVPLSAPPAAANQNVSTPKRDPLIDLLSGDLLGGDDYSSPTQNSLALVPVSAPQPPSPVASEQNALALVDMFSAVSSTQTPISAPPAFSSGPEYQQQPHLHPQQSPLYQNGMTPNVGSPYEQSGSPQPPGPWGAQSVQLQPQPSSPASGMQNGSVMPPPPWELQSTDAQLQQPMQPQGLPAVGNEQVPSMFMQPITNGQLPATNQSYQMPMYPQQMPGMIPHQMQPTQMNSMYPQQMYVNQMPGYGYGYQMPGYGNQMPGYGNQMPGYGNQMAAYGYGGYGQQQDAQYLDQRMYGLSVKDDSAIRGSASSQTSMASYLPPMKKQSQGDDKLFGDLVNMAKIKPTTTTPGRSGSM